MKSEEQTPTQEPGSVTFTVVGQNGSQTKFKIKPNVPMRKMMESYAERSSVSVASLRFLYNGERINPDHTAASIGLQDDDIIDVVLSQTGGA